MPKRKLQGEIVSNKMDKTVVVKVRETKFNSKYSRYYNFHKKYKAQVENSADYQIGQKVTIEESRPISKTKKWIVLK